MKKRTRKKRTRTGSSSGVTLLVALALLTGAALLAGSGKGKPQSAAYALIAGTVFRENGASLAGAQVVVEAAGTSPSKFKKIKTITDGRGEFAVRLPAAAMSYKVTAAAPGYQAQDKPVSTAGEDRIDVFFRLEPASK